MNNKGAKKGDRVKILEGDGEGQLGEVFWIGSNKWGPGSRLGVRGDDGETYWVSEDSTELTETVAPPPEPGATYQKGDRVAFTQRGQQGEGTVFWTGQSRGGGQRLGIRLDDAEDAVWLDARFARPVEVRAVSARAEPRPSPVEPARADEDGYVEFTPPLGPDDLPPMAPIDDDYADQMASSMDEAPEEAPHDW